MTVRGLQFNSTTNISTQGLHSVCSPHNITAQVFLLFSHFNYGQGSSIKGGFCNSVSQCSCSVIWQYCCCFFSNQSEYLKRKNSVGTQEPETKQKEKIQQGTQCGNGCFQKRFEFKLISLSGIRKMISRLFL